MSDAHNGGSKPRLLDLFCGAGGAAMGYHRAGFEVVGVDIKPQPNYPFEFIQADALDVLESLIVDYGWNGAIHTGTYLDVRPQLESNPLIRRFDAIHASPPCQAYSILGKRWVGRSWPDLISPTRELLKQTGLPYVIENVPGAPLENPVMLCGGGFMPVVKCDDGKHRQLRRHRYFETNWPLMAYPCWHPYPALGVYGNGRWSNDDSKHRGGYQGDKRENADAMGIDWMTRDELSEAIPPAYTEFIGRELLRELQGFPRPKMVEVGSEG